MTVKKTKGSKEKQGKTKTKKEQKELPLEKESGQEVQEKTKGKYIYVYGIANKQDFNLEIKGLNDKLIKKIDFKEVSVLTSDYPTLHPILKEEEAMHHAEILRKIAQKTTVIPMGFGMVFKEQKFLETVLTKAYQAIKGTLKIVENKIELGVKVVKKESDDAPNGTALEILESLNELAVKNREGDKFSDRLLLNYSFLVERNKFSEFSEKIGELEERHQELKFLYTGPWPPYSFVNIKIQGG